MKRRLSVSADADDAEEETVLTLNVGDSSSQSHHQASQKVQMDLYHPEVASASVDTEDSGTDIPVSQLFCIATPNYSPEEDSILSLDRLSFPLDDILCAVCKHILNRAVEAPCCQQAVLCRMHLVGAQLPSSKCACTQRIEYHPKK